MHFAEHPARNDPRSPDAPIFIFGTGQRCGSTLLQRFLCTHPQVIIWGEHDGILNKIFPGFERLQEWQALFGHHYDKYRATGVAKNFIANMNPPQDYVQQTQRQLIENYWRVPAEKLGKTIWGFKEILYEAKVALTLRELFPSMRLIFITRHPFMCFRSVLHEERLKPGETYVPLKEIWTRARTIEALGYWVSVNRSFIDTPGLTEDWVFRVKYEDFINPDRATAHQMITWLGLNSADFDFSVFDYKIYTDRHSEPDNRPEITWADLNAEEYTLVTSDEIRAITGHYGYEMPAPRPKGGYKL